MTIHIDKKVKRKLKKTYLWRYMSFAKFLDLITTSELYFASNKELIKGDPYEGTLPAFINAMFSIEKDSLSYKNLPDDARNYLEPFFIDDSIQNLKKDMNKAREHTFINCWHINDDENYLMWESYAKGDSGIAIVTDIDSLTSSINSDYDINLIPVQYVNNIRENPNDLQDLNKLVYESSLYKKEFFKNENELRLIYQGVNSNRVKVDIDKLIKHIYISPKSSEHSKNIILNTINCIKHKNSLNLDFNSILTESAISKYRYDTSNLEMFFASATLQQYSKSNENMEENDKKDMWISLLFAMLSDTPPHKLPKLLENMNNKVVSSKK